MHGVWVTPGCAYVGWTTFFLSTEQGTGGCTKRHPPYEGDAVLRVQHVGWTTFFLSTERGTGGCTKRHPPYEGRCFLTRSARRADNVFLSTERGTGGWTKRHPPSTGDATSRGALCDAPGFAVAPRRASRARATRPQRPP